MLESTDSYVTQTLLFGCTSFDSETNTLVLNATIDYILSTERFECLFFKKTLFFICNFLILLELPLVYYVYQFFNLIYYYFQFLFLCLFAFFFGLTALLKETLAQVFSCEFCETSKNTFFTERLWSTAYKKCVAGKFKIFLNKSIPHVIRVWRLIQETFNLSRMGDIVLSMHFRYFCLCNESMN